MKKEELKKLFESLTLEEKIGQLVQLSASFFEEHPGLETGPMEKIGFDKSKSYLTGSIINTLGAERLMEIQKNYLENNEKKIPAIFMADIINGYKTVFPIPISLGCSFDEDLVKRSARVAAYESSASGLHVTFSPMVDLVRDARWGRVMESFSEDPFLNSVYSKAMVEGYQNNDEYSISACVKHYAAYGAPVAGREYNAVELGERALREFYLPPYKAAVDAGCDMVMTSFNTIDQVPATASTFLLEDVLRKEWGFKGTVVSDHSAIKELIAHGVAKDDLEAAKLALIAGCDIDMNTSVYSNSLKKLVEEKVIDEALIDKSCMRVLELKNKLGLFENPYRYASVEAEKKILSPEFREIAKEAVLKSVVLLKNDNGVLPLKNEEKIGLIGPLADSKFLYGMWSFHADPNSVVTIKAGLEKMSNNVTYTLGSNVLDDTSEVAGFGFPIKADETLDKEAEYQKAEEVAKNSDTVVLCLGEHFLQSGEGGAKASLKLEEVQTELFERVRKVAKKVVVLMFGGRPLEIANIVEKADAVMQCYMPGIEGGNGIADLLYGVVSPSGKLTLSIPRAVGQCPIYYNSLRTGRPLESAPHMIRFSSRYLDMPNDPLFSFGYGLSYAKFEYNNLKLSAKNMTKNDIITVTVDLKNDSNVVAEEIVQLYIHDKVATVSRPVKELKAYKRVKLSPNETKTVEFEINSSMLMYYKLDMSYGLDAGEFDLFVGASSVDNLTTSFELID